jgi:hypothetical protein
VYKRVLINTNQEMENAVKKQSELGVHKKVKVSTGLQCHLRRKGEEEGRRRRRRRRRKVPWDT